MAIPFLQRHYQKFSVLLTGIAVLILLMPGILHAEVRSLPELGGKDRALMSEKEEYWLGLLAMRQERRQTGYVEDPEIEAYLESLGARLTAPLEKPADYHFFLIRDPTINAYALPGGFIGVHTGLILSARNESELAAVLAHEITHIHQHHLARMMVAQQEGSGLTAAALLASIILAASGENVGEAGIALVTAAQSYRSLSFTRAFEREADRLGIRLLDAAGFDPAAMAGFFERLQNSNRLTNTPSPEYMRTHPITTNRIAEARDRSSGLRKVSVRNNNQDLWHIQARTRALFSKSATQANDELSDIIRKRKGNEQEAALYGQALAQLRLRRPERALIIARRLRNQNPKNIRYMMLQADILLQSGNKQEGLKLYQQALKRVPNERSVMIRYTSALLANGHPRQADAILRPATKRNPSDAEFQRLFAKAAGESGNQVGSHRALAEYYYLTGDPAAAIGQLKIARGLAKEDSYTLAGIDARLKEIERDTPDLPGIMAKIGQ